MAPGYERRLRVAYPVHPELFDRVHKDWSGRKRFQRTPGVLRLMAQVDWRLAHVYPALFDLTLHGASRPGSVPKSPSGHLEHVGWAQSGAKSQVTAYKPE
jgi:hypothetical protein